MNTPFRYDFVGSFLRPEKVKNAKALYEDGKIEKEELAWILLNFNQKRGYYQLREEETEKASSKTRQYFDSQIVTDITDTGQIYKGLKIS